MRKHSFHKQGEWSEGRSRRKNDESANKQKQDHTFDHSPHRYEKRRKIFKHNIPDVSDDEESSETMKKEDKIVQCWSCKGYGHKAGNKECPLFHVGNIQADRLRWSFEDPMRQYIENRRRLEKEARVEQLKALIDSSTSSDSSCGEERHSSRVRKKKIKKKKSKKRKRVCSDEGDSCVKDSKPFSGKDKPSTKRHKHSHHSTDVKHKTKDKKSHKQKKR